MVLQFVYHSTASFLILYAVLRYSAIYETQQCFSFLILKWFNLITTFMRWRDESVIHLHGDWELETDPEVNPDFTLMVKSLKCPKASLSQLDLQSSALALLESFPVLSSTLHASLSSRWSRHNAQNCRIVERGEQCLAVHFVPINSTIRSEKF